MNPIRLTDEEAEDLWRDERGKYQGLDLEQYMEGDWEDDGKYSHLEVIYQDQNSGKFYRLNISRTGSYYSDYYYNVGPELYEVKAATKTITYWVGAGV